MSAARQDCIALIAAAGRGTRFGARWDAPKQYLPLAGTSVLRHAVQAFAGHPSVGGVRVVIHGDDRAHYEAATAGLDLMAPVVGGANSARFGAPRS